MFKRNWSNWKTFFISLISALIAMFFVAPFYFYVFSPSSGYLAGDDIDIIESYSFSFLFFYTFVTAFLHVSFAIKPKALTVLYFVVLPFFFFMAAGSDRLLAGVSPLIAGALLGSWVRRFVRA